MRSREGACKTWWGHKHDWHKALYSEFVQHSGGEKPLYHNGQLYGTKKCGRCGIFADGYAEKNHPTLADLLPVTEAGKV